MQDDLVKPKQFNVRLTDEEAASLSLLAMRSGVTPSEFLRHLIRQAAEGSAVRMSKIHLDVLTAMSMDPTTAKNALDLLNEVPHAGNKIAHALSELEYLGHVVRAPSGPRGTCLITESGKETAKKR